MATFGIRALGLACLATLGLSSAALAIDDPNLHPPNFAFPANEVGYRLATSGGVVNPGLIVGFNPQPEPPGDQFVNLRDPFAPIFATFSRNKTFDFVLSFQGGTFHIVAPDQPNSDGRARISACDGSVMPSGECDGSVFIADLAFMPVDVSWRDSTVSPPANTARKLVMFGADAFVTLQLTEDGTPLSFSLATPEPATWAMLGLGFAGLGVAGLRQARRAAA